MSGYSSDEESELFEKPPGLVPFSYEPKRSRTTGSERDIDNKEESRIGRLDWCSCGNCKMMSTESESLCCRETGVVPGRKLNGNINFFPTSHQSFCSV